MADFDYDALAARLTDPDQPLLKPISVLVGDEAAASGRAFLLAEYGSEEALAEVLRSGRPRRDAEHTGPSPVVRGRLPQNEYEALKGLEVRTGRSQSALVREAVHLLLTRYAQAS